MLKNDFPLLRNNPSLIYFDNAATSQKPTAVINALKNFYEHSNAPVHRGLYKLAEEATALFEHARQTVAVFIGATDPSEIIVTKSATEGINFIANAWALHNLKSGDEIVISELEHHSNMIPWQLVAKKTGVQLKYIPVDEQGQLRYEKLDEIITKRTKLIACTQSSNAIGTQVNIEKIIKHARTVGAKVLIDACQTVPHQKVDVQNLQCDFLVFSAHKMLGPTGVGILYIKKEIQHEVEPYQVGGGMIFEASYEQASWLKPPQCYEAGTQPVAELIALAQAIEYLQNEVDFAALKKYEAALCAQLIDGLQRMKTIRILGPVDQLKKEGHVVSFAHEKIHAHDIAAYLDTHSICVRSGHFCAQPLAKKLGIVSAVRASFYLYNTAHEIDRLLNVIEHMKL
jgi:cysteine desulfurase/selenocysteine lyase